VRAVTGSQVESPLKSVPFLIYSSHLGLVPDSTDAETPGGSVRRVIVWLTTT